MDYLRLHKNLSGGLNFFYFPGGLNTCPGLKTIDFTYPGGPSRYSPLSCVRLCQRQYSYTRKYRLQVLQYQVNEYISKYYYKKPVLNQEGKIIPHPIFESKISCLDFTASFIISSNNTFYYSIILTLEYTLQLYILYLEGYIKQNKKLFTFKLVLQKL